MRCSCFSGIKGSFKKQHPEDSLSQELLGAKDTAKQGDEFPALTELMIQWWVRQIGKKRLSCHTEMSRVIKMKPCAPERLVGAGEDQRVREGHVEEVIINWDPKDNKDQWKIGEKVFQEGKQPLWGMAWQRKKQAHVRVRGKACGYSSCHPGRREPCGSRGWGPDAGCRSQLWECCYLLFDMWGKPHGGKPPFEGRALTSGSLKEHTAASNGFEVSTRVYQSQGTWWDPRCVSLKVRSQHEENPSKTAEWKCQPPEGSTR